MIATMAETGDGPLAQRPTGRPLSRNRALRRSPTESERPRGRPGDRPPSRLFVFFVFCDFRHFTLPPPKLSTTVPPALVAHSAVKPMRPPPVRPGQASVVRVRMTVPFLKTSTSPSGWKRAPTTSPAFRTPEAGEPMVELGDAVFTASVSMSTSTEVVRDTKSKEERDRDAVRVSSLRRAVTATW